MRLPSPSSLAALRQQYVEQARRDRAAAPQLRAAFPKVQQLRLELKFHGKTTNIPASQSHVLHPPARAFFEIPCPYADCNGRFDLTAVVSLLMADRLPKAEGMLTCQGHRPDRLSTRMACQLQLNYEFTVTYH